VKLSLIVSLVLHLIVVVWLFRTGTRIASAFWTWQSRPQTVWISEVPSPVPAVKHRPSPSAVVSPQVPASESGVSETETENNSSEQVVSVEDFARWGNVKPGYPKLAAERGWEGNVELKLVFRDKTPEVYVLKSSGYDLLDQAAQRAAEKWTLPAELEDKVATYIVPVNFKLEDTDDR
jgi:TonB family protein